MTVTKQDLIDGFKALGIQDGDDIFVTSSLSRFGHVEGGTKTVVDALEEVVGCGTIVMPSFNFSIFKKKPIVLDLKNTPSEMGVITEEFRKQTGVKRTTNLFHPLCHKGKLSEMIDKCDMVDTWGNESPYALMERENFKVVLLGTDFYCCPFFHYAEQKNNVPYREPVTYSGLAGGLHVECRRLRRKYGDSDNNKVDDWLPYKRVKIGNAICRSFNVQELMKPLSERLEIDPNYLLSESDLLSPMPTMDTFDMMEGIKELFKEDRGIASQGFDNCFYYINKFIPIRWHTWQPDTKVWTWTTPPVHHLSVFEFTVRGYSDDTILFPIHLDHAGMANDNLSGVVVAIELALRLLRTSDLRHSYKFLFVPETIGTIAFLSNYTKKPLFGIVIDSVGTQGYITVTKSKFTDKLNKYITLATNEFISTEHLKSGNDERVLECSGIPAVQFSRAPFKEYHTTNDTPDIIIKERLEDTVSAVYDFILRIERDFKPVPTYQGVPCLSAYGLWDEEHKIDHEKIYQLLGYGFTVMGIANRTNLSFKFVYDFIRSMEKAGLIKR